MMNLLGEFRWRYFFCRFFGHWWRAFWCVRLSPYPYGMTCRNCGVTSYARPWPLPPKPPAK